MKLDKNLRENITLNRGMFIKLGERARQRIMKSLISLPSLLCGITKERKQNDLVIHIDLGVARRGR